VESDQKKGVIRFRRRKGKKAGKNTHEGGFAAKLPRQQRWAASGLWSAALSHRFRCPNKAAIKRRTPEAAPPRQFSRKAHEVAFQDLANAELFLALMREFHGQPAS